MSQGGQLHDIVVVGYVLLYGRMVYGVGTAFVKGYHAHVVFLYYIRHRFRFHW